MKKAPKKTAKALKAEVVPKQVGRQSAYRPEYGDQLIECLEDGDTLTDFAAEISVSRQTIYNWLATYPDFKECFDIGMPKAQRYWNKIGKQIANGTIRGNAAVWFGNMYNRFRDDWKPENQLALADPSTKVSINVAYQRPVKVIEQSEDEDKD